MTTDIKIADRKRLKDRKAKLLKATTIREAAYSKMKTFRKSIEVVLELKTVDVAKYTNYLNNINWAMADFRSSYLSKTTRTRNAALETEQEKETEEDSEPLNSTSDNAATGGELNVATFNNMNLQKNSTKNESPTNKVLDNATNGGDVLPISTVKSDDAIKSHSSTSNGSDKESEK